MVSPDRHGWCVAAGGVGDLDQCHGWRWRLGGVEVEDGADWTGGDARRRGCHWRWPY